MTARVACYAGHRGEETPRTFTAEGETLAVEEVVARWREPTWRCFRVKAEGGKQYLLRHHEETGRWEVDPDPVR